MRGLVWFRRDLRVNDNRALYNACKECRQVVAVYFLTPGQWKNHHDAPAKIAFWLTNLKLLEKSLSDLNISLQVIKVDSFKEIPETILQLAERLKSERLYYNSEYEFNEAVRDRKVEAKLTSAGIKCCSYHDRLLIQPDKVLTGQGKPYTVFTPFRNNWAKQIFKNDIEVLPAPKPLAERMCVLSGINGQLALSAPEFTSRVSAFDHDLWPPGEIAAARRLTRFFDEAAENYHKNRDLPAVSGTSRLSPYFAAGAISPRQCLKRILDGFSSGKALPSFDTGPGTWLNELVWRDFYSHVLVAFPRVSKGIPFQLATEKVKWRYDEKQLKAWKDGLTGYPIVDAAMRQLKQTGWMHNRLRMITAMFFSKDLLLDWRDGERWFMQNLIDGDLAANNGGWQWSASTGTDAAPYFRIFNPFSQSKKFDAKGEFIKKYCPELAPVSAKALHDSELLKAEIEFFKVDYPAPVVDHSEARYRAIAAFK